MGHVRIDEARLRSRLAELGTPWPAPGTVKSVIGTLSTTRTTWSLAHDGIVETVEVNEDYPSRLTDRPRKWRVTYHRRRLPTATLDLRTPAEVKEESDRLAQGLPPLPRKRRRRQQASVVSGGLPTLGKRR